MYLTMSALVFGAFFLILALACWIAYKAWKNWERRAKEAGYASLGLYLRAVPSTDKEKREAVDLALKGIVICLMGLLIPPLLIVGLVPLFYGARKVIFASMGLGLIDDSE